MIPDEHAPIACTLRPGEFRKRLAWIAALRRDALIDWKRSDLTLTLRFAHHAREDVRELVRREQACCGFLRFDLLEESDEITLTVTAPEHARLAADLLFAFFVGAAGEDAAASRCSASRLFLLR